MSSSSSSFIRTNLAVLVKVVVRVLLGAVAEFGHGAREGAGRQMLQSGEKHRAPANLSEKGA